MAYINKELFMLANPHRDIEDWPGISQFAEMVKLAAADINSDLQVDADICDLDDGTTVSEQIKRIVGILIEAKLNWLEAAEKPDFDGRAEPTIDNVIGLRDRLDTLKGEEDEPAYYHEFHNWYGGGARI